MNGEYPDDVEVGFVALDTGLAPPVYAHHDDAGADLVSAETFDLQPGERRLVGTGVAVALPEGYAGFVHPRSGLAARHGISIVNAPGTVDAGYRGEILVCLVNTDTATAVRISRGDRIAQLVVQRVARARFVAVAQLPDSTVTAGRSMGTAGRSRGTGGHGSTGGLAAGDTTDEEQQPA
ncbi:MAG TPA: dUTP diphosphatase [Microlunatus sp.]